MKLALGIVVALGLSTWRTAEASSLRCWGQMRLPNCLEPDRLWPAGPQVSFTAQCEGCPGPNDAGATCTPVPPRTGDFVLTGGGQRLQNPGPADQDTTVYFEESGWMCDGVPLFRYKGLLHPGVVYQIDLGGHDFPPAPLTFEVEDYRVPTDRPGFAPPSPPSPAPGPATPSSHHTAGGCAFAVGRPPLAWMGLAVLAWSLRGRRGSRRRR
jgi:hypothetical protein